MDSVIGDIKWIQVPFRMTLIFKLNFSDMKMISHAWCAVYSTEEYHTVNQVKLFPHQCIWAPWKWYAMHNAQFIQMKNTIQQIKLNCSLINIFDLHENDKLCIMYSSFNWRIPYSKLSWIVRSSTYLITIKMLSHA